MRIVQLLFKDLDGNRKRNIGLIIGIFISVLILSTMLMISNTFKVVMMEEMKVANEDIITMAFGNKNNSLNYTYLSILSEDDLASIKDVKNLSDYTGVKITQASSISTIDGEKILKNNIFGLDEIYLDAYDIEFERGKFPATDNEVLIGSDVAESRDLKVGDSLFVEVGTNTKEYKISGILTKQKSQEFSTVPSEINNMIGIDKNNSLINNLDYSFFLIKIKDIELLDKTSLNLEDILNSRESLKKQLDKSSLEVISVNQQSVIDMVDRWFHYINLFLLIIAIIISMTSILNIFNILRVNIISRTKDIAIFKVAGASNENILKYFMIQTLIMGIITSVLALLCSIILSKIITYLVSWKMQMSIGGIVLPILVGVIISLISGYLTSKKAILVDIREALME